MNRKAAIIFSCFLFVLLLALGFWQAFHKPLWIDEHFGLISSVERLSYGDILLGRMREGNNSPLFFLIQKGICDVAGYEPPAPWLNGDWDYQDVGSQILTRVNPVFFMSLSVALIFYYFSRTFGLWPGVYSLAVSLSSFMVWTHWAEARPYALWVFLTTVQSLIFLRIVGQSENARKAWLGLALVHFLLSLTIFISIVQIVVVSSLVWFLSERDWRKYVLILVVPMGVAVTYHLSALKLAFWFAEGPWALIGASIPLDRLLIVVMFGVYFALAYFCPKSALFTKLSIRSMGPQEKRTAGGYLGFVLLMLLGFLAVLMKLKMGESPNHQGFQISNRYFIPMTPIGIFATTLFSIYLVKASSKRTLRGAIFLSLAGLLVFRMIRTMNLA